MYNTTFLTGKEVAAILKISKALAYRLLANGDIPSVRFGRTVRVKQEDLEKFIAKNSSSGSSTDLDQDQKSDEITTFDNPEKVHL